jgi:hypothetical protein
MEVIKITIFLFLFFLAYSCRKVEILPDDQAVKSDTVKPKDPNIKCKCDPAGNEIPELPPVSPPVR